VEMSRLHRRSAGSRFVVIDGGDDDDDGEAKRRRRPDLRKIVDDTFRHGSADGERVAVLVCGPAGMARELRAHVGAWVARGRDVWFHDEGFGW